MMELDDLTFFIPDNTPSSKNSKVWTGKYFLPSAYTRKWIKRTKQDWINQRGAFVAALATLSPPYFIEFTFIRKTKHKFDYINIAQAPLDQMTLHGWLPDDNADVVKPYFGDYIYDKNNPGLLIKILKEKPKHE